MASRWLALVLVLGGVKGESFMDFLRSRRDLTQVRLPWILYTSSLTS